MQNIYRLKEWKAEQAPIHQYSGIIAVLQTREKLNSVKVCIGLKNLQALSNDVKQRIQQNKP